MDIGEKIKRLRIEKQLTQEELANRCELSKGFISQIERNLTSPSIATLTDILDTLGTNLPDFFKEDSQEKIVFKKDDMGETSDDELKYNLMWLVSNSQKDSMEPVMLTLYENGCYLEDEPHEGEEFGYVLKGTIYLKLGNKKFKVKSGESFYFKPNVNHQILNAGKKTANLIWISTPPSF
ncbi:helix-turn-helix domain-containing protein [Clostridium felsineum]|uniref:HTH-type transcriptional regulator PuuR n=1 Tax=Clostridium felsineum TaxID=36839 RepID=A0A1S8LP49_9CLOT|nr:XRE family transcriptional regulator [Clostridium felsineum]MCR3761290.1 XRE family transcriptional regulator [Clostridium felsineum]URZ01519.1 HTH-type transcriptional regulator PuuR [Clostridium felsineum]URZ05634.1 HTH-type transcriptional regulator PuuR [Clostridium felsineum]URZ10673.1 HTH-type transcriptional regulator PuuR [Clostridium felsineum]URZ17412.1 HTH-type transcriptional regulator PuuR [Clostridium felsineum DSM 794]